jgi:hypothetical protein
MEKSGKRNTGWRGLGTRIEVLELDKLAGTKVGELADKVNALQVNDGGA